MKQFLYRCIAFCSITFISTRNIVAQEYQTLPMWNTKLSNEARVKDLVGRLSLEEKVAQMLNNAPAIQRLGIPAYDWWSEALHGVARTPFKVTSFPQAIAMAATWDTAALGKMAGIAALEGRAIYNIALQKGRTNERYWGLTYWTPNINIFRDPRWGRGQETYGEDPFLTAMMGSAFVKGLQGNDSKYWKAAACAKHYAVHSGPESSRHSDNFVPTSYDLWDTYLPAFKELITKSHVAGVMCAYNALNGQPCCGNDLLMNDILRNQWKFTGYVTSDCWAIDDFFRYHKTHANATVSAADALIHGTDLECGTAVYKTLVDAVKQGFVKERVIDSSITRLFLIRYKLGMFDPADQVPYAKTNESVLSADAHLKHALDMAHKSMVLLKNANNTLPLSKKIKKIAVIGPNADNRIAMLGNYNGTPKHVVSILEGIQQKLGSQVDVIYEKVTDFAHDTLFVPSANATVLSNGYKASFYNNTKLEGQAVATQQWSQLDQFWNEGASPAAGVNPFNFSARIETQLHANADVTYTFQVSADEGYRVYINDSLKLDAWKNNRWGPQTFTVKMQAGVPKNLRIEYYQLEGPASVKLVEGSYQKTDVEALKKRLQSVDAIVFAGGISPQLEGEEMKVAVPGFSGGDRTTIELPQIQRTYLKALETLGKPLVFVMMTGSAIAIAEEQQHVPAILNAWYGGQYGGTAVADILFGDFNPSGRNPVTFYASDADLPGFKDYSMDGRTYRYFKGKPLYPFGYGLSYTTFNYQNLGVQPLKTKSTYAVTVTVQNTGKMAGDEVVQLYVSHQGAHYKAAIRSLRGFKKIHLHAGEKKNVTFTLHAEDLTLINEQGQAIQPGGKWLLSVGGGQPAVDLPVTSNVVTTLLQTTQK